jgi:hypothetical protein
MMLALCHPKKFASTQTFKRIKPLGRGCVFIQRNKEGLFRMGERYNDDAPSHLMDKRDFNVKFGLIPSCP